MFRHSIAQGAHTKVVFCVSITNGKSLMEISCIIHYLSLATGTQSFSSHVTSF